MKEMDLDHSFSEVFNLHKGHYADKWEGYLFVYDEIFLNWKTRAFTLLEIGVDNGGSLEVFLKFFTNIEVIVGIDINENCSNIEFEDNRIKVLVGDSTKESSKEQIKKISNQFDIVIDDGSHFSPDIIKNFINLIELVSYGGIYIIEDLCCSYWKSYGGGLSNKLSANNFFKKLIDIINYQHWDEKVSIKDLLSEYDLINIDDKTIEKLNFIKGISFYNSICIIKFHDFSYQKGIGKRLCRGVPSINHNVGKNGDDILDISPNK